MRYKYVPELKCKTQIAHVYQNVFFFVFLISCLCSSIKNNFVRFFTNQTLTKLSCGKFMLTNVKLQVLKNKQKNKPKWLVSEVTGHPSVKKTKLLLEWPPTIELEMRKTPNYLQLTCVAWTNGHRDDGTCAESGRALGLLPTFSYWLFYSIIWFWSFKMIVDKFWHTRLFRLNMNRQRKDETWIVTKVVHSNTVFLQAVVATTILFQKIRCDKYWLTVKFAVSYNPDDNKTNATQPPFRDIICC